MLAHLGIVIVLLQKLRLLVEVRGGGIGCLLAFFFGCLIAFFYDILSGLGDEKSKHILSNPTGVRGGPRGLDL